MSKFFVVIDSFEQWRENARKFLANAVLPEHVSWSDQSANELALFETDGTELEASLLARPTPTVPKAFFALGRDVACFRDPEKWHWLYKLAWRLVYENRLLLNNSIDPDVSKLKSMQKSVRRDLHKMKAFVRFQRIVLSENELLISERNYVAGEEAESHGANERYIAWFEPEHFILRSVTVFFKQRFTNMHWSILTPDECVSWDQKRLHFSAGWQHKPKIVDDVESLWLEYYRSTFNPARLKLKAMQSEMPKKYWKNLPETVLIEELSNKAADTTGKMIETAVSTPWKKTEGAKLIQTQRSQLRNR